VGLTADLVLGLFREDLYEVDLGVTGATELSLLKHRDGAIGYVDLYHDARYLRFEDVLDPAR
jgi:replicative DNA helicase